MSYRTSLPLHETEDDKPKKKRERGRDLVHYKVPGTENTYRVTTRRKMKKAVRKHKRANQKMKKVKNTRRVRASF